VSKRKKEEKAKKRKLCMAQRRHQAGGPKEGTPGVLSRGLRGESGGGGYSMVLLPVRAFMKALTFLSQASHSLGLAL
jgi:hypothetical protein